MVQDDRQQQHGSINQPEPSVEDLRAACGRVIAFVTAFGPRSEQCKNDIASAISTIKNAQMAAVFVLADAECAADAVEAVRTSGRRGQTMVQAVEFDPGAIVEVEFDASELEKLGLSASLVETARIVAESVLDDHRAVFIMDAAQNQVTVDQLYQTCLYTQEREVEVVALPAQKANRLPVLIARSFLES